jgi:serine/threonine-protein kinase
MQEQAKELLVQTVGPREFLVGRTLSNLGGFYTDMERHDEAREALRQAREILEEHLSPGHPELAAAIANLARVELAAGRFAEALAGFDEAIALLEASMGHDHVALANELLGRGEAQLGLARHAAALVDLRRAVDVLERAQAAPEPLAEARSELAGALWAAGERAEAIREMERARALVEGIVVADEQLRTNIEAWLRDPDGRERPG